MEPDEDQIKTVNQYQQDFAEQWHHQKPNVLGTEGSQEGEVDALEEEIKKIRSDQQYMSEIGINSNKT